MRSAECGVKIHGEIFICVDDAIKQAKEFKTNWQAETVRYVVHGVLHLLGYDDLKPDLRRKMKREENRLVRRLEKRFALAELSPPVKMVA
jgi:probable rRNA maturation factor